MKGLLIMDKIFEIDQYLSSEIKENSIINYKIVLQLSMKIEVMILVSHIRGNEFYFRNPLFEKLEAVIRINEIKYEEEDQNEYDLIFSKKIDFGIRRRLVNLIDPLDNEKINPCPIITFYSYKGGTGRTTSLAFFASWLATHHGKKVVIIDCDFEAPGLTNYFDISEDKKGLTEYLLDAEYARHTGQLLDIKKDYVHQVRFEYVGKGDVFVVPAGNLSNYSDETSRSNMSDYLEALARMDITSVSNMLFQLQNFITELHMQLQLDEDSVILVDSRTGFNDTFAVLSILSDIIVGFFGINKQSQTGLMQFLDRFGTIDSKKSKQVVLVNSISENLNYFQVFKEFINNYVSSNEATFTDPELGMKNFISNVFRIPRVEFLGRIGTLLENADKGSLDFGGTSTKEIINLQFHTKVQRPDSEFEDFFNDLNAKINFIKESSESQDFNEDDYKPKENAITEGSDGHLIDDNFFKSITDKVDKIFRRQRVLENIILEKNFPKPYADTGEEKPKKSDFFFRDCMKDIFNRDKYVIIGYKGTGKTHIYRAFENKEITDTLCNRESQNPNDYIFVNVIPIEKHLKYFSTDDGFMEDEKNKVGVDYFFKSFWMIYSWSSLFKNQQIQNLEVIPSMDVFDIDEMNVEKILQIISSRELISSISLDLSRLDAILLERKKIIILSYDQIDFVVKPNNWNIGVAPLINYWRTNQFSRIYPKVFVRADIFVDRLTNITNFNEIQQEKSISLQWTKQELFAYFFKYIFRISKEDFFALSYSYKKYSKDSKEILMQIENGLDSEGQISVLREDYLKFLVESFFGKYADRYERGRFVKRNVFGENYDWFYRNLTDAKNAISIRPFLDLMYKAISMALTKESLHNAKKFHYQQNQLLSAFYFTSHDAKAHAAERYYNDLAKDKGNEPLRLFYQYIKNDGLERFRIYEFTREQLDDLLKRIIEFTNYKNEESLKNKSIDDFKNLLVNNGILGVKHITNRQLTRYIIPFLYRSYFAVSNPNKSKSIKNW